jgi:hypothetical protein
MSVLRVVKASAPRPSKRFHPFQWRLNMTATISGGIYAHQYEWQDHPEYSFLPHVAGREDNQRYYKEQEYVWICDYDIEVIELPDGEFRARQIDSLKVKQNKLREEFVKQSQVVNDRIQNLLCITDDREDKDALA